MNGPCLWIIIAASDCIHGLKHMYVIVLLPSPCRNCLSVFHPLYEEFDCCHLIHGIQVYSTSSDRFEWSGTQKLSWQYPKISESNIKLLRVGSRVLFTNFRLPYLKAFFSVYYLGWWVILLLYFC